MKKNILSKNKIQKIFFCILILLLIYAIIKTVIGRTVLMGDDMGMVSSISIMKLNTGEIKNYDLDDARDLYDTLRTTKCKKGDDSTLEFAEGKYAIIYYNLSNSEIDKVTMVGNNMYDINDTPWGHYHFYSLEEEDYNTILDEITELTGWGK